MVFTHGPSFGAGLVGGTPSKFTHAWFSMVVPVARPSTGSAPKETQPISYPLSVIGGRKPAIGSSGVSSVSGSSER